MTIQKLDKMLRGSEDYPEKDELWEQRLPSGKPSTVTATTVKAYTKN